PLPPVAREWPENRWDYFAADTAETALFRGETLLHTDINPSNVLIGRQHTWVVDWAWPTRGAAFIDIACLVVQLIASGHHPESAEEWASSCAVWAEAEPKAVDAFAAANLRMYRRRADRNPETEWLQAMADAAQKWADLRTGSTPSNLANSWRR
ncbi:MAG: protein kinase, partial [Actinomycetes bacterium]